MQTIRKIAEKEVNEVSRLICKTLREINIADYPKEIIEKICIKYSPEGIKNLTKKRDIFVLIENNKIAATGALEGNVICGMFVDSERLEQGLGTKMINHLESVAKKNNYNKTELPASLTAYKFYKKLGYEKVREVNEHQIPEIIMEKYI